MHSDQSAVSSIESIRKRPRPSMNDAVVHRIPQVNLCCEFSLVKVRADSDEYSDNLAGEGSEKVRHGVPVLRVH